MNFTDIYQDTSEADKIKFLSAIIQHNNDLQEQFLHFVGNTKKDTPLNASNFGQDVAYYTQTYTGILESIDLENPDWDFYRPSHGGYIEEWEEYQQASEQEFEQIFDQVKSSAIDDLIKQQVVNVLTKVIGLYEASLNAEIDDDYNSFDSVNGYLTETHESMMHGLIEKIKMSAISSIKVKEAIVLFFDYCDEEYPSNPTYPVYFESLLLALAEKSGQPNELLAALDASQISRKSLPRLVLLLQKKGGDNASWLQSAQAYYQDSQEVAGDLLEHYFKQDKRAFIKIANELFVDKPVYWAGWLEKYVAIDLDRDLFIKVHYQLTLDKTELEHYLKIRTFLSAADLNRLLKELRHEMEFKVRILEVEGRFEDIKQLVQQNANDWNYSALIKPLLDVYPDYCFNHIKDRAERTLVHERGRSTYQRIVNWLQLAKKIKGHEPQTQSLITSLFNYKPNLPALKDEMRKGGIV